MAPWMMAGCFVGASGVTISRCYRLGLGNRRLRWASSCRRSSDRNSVLSASTRSPIEHGSNCQAASPAISGRLLVFEQATGTPHAMASRTGSPNPSIEQLRVVRVRVVRGECFQHPFPREEPVSAVVAGLACFIMGGILPLQRDYIVDIISQLTT